MYWVIYETLFIYLFIHLFIYLFMKLLKINRYFEKELIIKLFSENER